jgi:photosystem II stability/assembly factor-like uncharacterized protein
LTGSTLISRAAAICAVAGALACGGDAPPPTPTVPVITTHGWTTVDGAPVAPQRHDDIVFVDRAHGWLVNIAGQIFKTVDGGAHWTLVHANNQRFYRSVGFANESVGWVGNLNGFNSPTPLNSLFETRDGGATWSNISNRVLSGPEPVGICGLWVVNSQIVYGVGRWSGPAIFVRSRDGGHTWQSASLAPYATGAVDVYFFDAERGIVVGGDGVGNTPDQQVSSHTVILMTNDVGDTWNIVYRSAAAANGRGRSRSRVRPLATSPHKARPPTAWSSRRPMAGGRGPRCRSEGTKASPRSASRPSTMDGSRATRPSTRPRMAERRGMRRRALDVR